MNQNLFVQLRSWLGKTFVLLLASSLFLATAADAQKKKEEEESRFANVKTQKVKPLSQAVGKQLEPVRECLAPEAPEGEKAPDPDGQCALNALKKVKIDKIQPHERAEVWNLYGYAYYTLENQPKSKEFYTKVVNEPEANAPLRTRTLKTVAQLHLIDEEYADALKFFKQWLDLQQQVGAGDWALYGQIFYSNEDYDNALVNIEKAIGIKEDGGSIAKENWYSIQRAIYYERGNLKKVESILNKLIVNYPNVRYWRELGGVYAEQEITDKQLGAFHLAYLQNGLTTESQIVGLAYLFIGADAPWKASKILIEGIEKGTIEDSEKNLQLLGSALYQSAELQKALPWMEKAAEKATSGESYARLAGIYVDLERFEDALRTAKEAIRRGDVRRLDLAKLNKGNAEFNLKKYDDAIKTFRSIKDKRTKKAADQWIRYVGSERKREKQIRDSGIDLDKILASR